MLSEVWKAFKSGPYGMVSVQASNDNGYPIWFGRPESEFVTGENLEMPIGKACNLHTQLFSHSLYAAFDGKLIPDVFVAYCTESIFSFCSAAVGEKWILMADVILDHLKSVDGATSGFHHQGPKGGTNNLFEGLDIDEVLKDPEAWESGFGYEEHCDYFPRS